MTDPDTINGLIGPDTEVNSTMSTRHLDPPVAHFNPNGNKTLQKRITPTHLLVRLTPYPNLCKGQIGEFVHP